MQIITSKENETIKAIKKLKDKKYRDLQNEYIVEGIKMIEEAVAENANIHKIVICEECVKDGVIRQKLLYTIAKYDVIYVTKKVYESITDVSNPQGILAVIEKKNEKQEIGKKDDLIVVLDGLQDPGNLGTILRTLDSANLKHIILSKDTADPYNPKVVRSTMGAIYRINMIVSEDIKETIRELHKNGYTILATSLQTNKSIYDVSYQKKAIIIGNEAKGVSKELLEMADEKIKIPMMGKTESLNASVATGIIVYEYVRQKLEKRK